MTKLEHVDHDLNTCDMLLIVGCALNALPCATWYRRVGAHCPRVMFDRIVPEASRHERVFRFDNALRFGAYRDVFVHGDCQLQIERLRQYIGW